MAMTTTATAAQTSSGNNYMVSIPVTLFDFTTSKDKRFTHCKLKLFHEEETKDNRFFTEKFKKKILKNLAAVPVVGFYHEDDEDFVGHNPTQYIYGHVPEGYTVEKLEEKGYTYFVTDVVLQTGRKDNIGTVAKKIIGKQHSLELDPDTLKVNVFQVGDKVTRLDYIDGDIIGLSVVGDNQTPGFTGSEFFTASQADEFTKVYYQRLNKFVDYLTNKRGEQVKNTVNFDELKFNEFLQLAHDTNAEKVTKLTNSLMEKGIYAYIMDIGEDWFVTAFNGEYLRYSYEFDDSGAVSKLGDPVEVVYRAITKDEAQTLSSDNTEANDANEFVDEGGDGGDSNENSDNTSTDAATATENADTGENNEGNEPVPASEPNSTPEEGNDSVENTETGESTEESGVSTTDSNEEGEKTEGEEPAAFVASTTDLDNAERNELELLRRQAKQAVIKDYEGDLSDKVLVDFTARLDEFTVDTLTSALAIEYRKAMKEKNEDESNSTATVTTFNLNSSDNNSASQTYDENCPTDVVKKYKNI